MKNCARIAAKHICSDYPFIVYSHTLGVLGGAIDFEGAKRIWEAEAVQCRERTRESDAMIFQWVNGQWVLCGNLYDLERTVPVCRA